MVCITFSDYLNLVEQNQYIGYINCFGGSLGKNGAPTVVALLDASLYLFYPDEIQNDDWMTLLNVHTQELERFNKEDI